MQGMLDEKDPLNVYEPVYELILSGLFTSPSSNFKGERNRIRKRQQPIMLCSALWYV